MERYRVRSFNPYEEDIERQQKVEKIIRETEGIFSGTGIIGYFQGIVASETPSFARVCLHYIRVFSRYYASDELVIPAKIEYRGDEVALLYHASYQTATDSNDGNFSHKEISVKKEGNNFRLIMPDTESPCGSTVTEIIKGAEDTINRIKHYLSGNTEKIYEGNIGELIGYSWMLDKRTTGK